MMPSKYDELGNYDSKTHPTTAGSFVLPGWKHYIDPFWKNVGGDPREDRPWMTFRTIQPSFDFRKAIDETCAITFVLKFQGHDSDTQSAWAVELDLRPQHNNTSLLKDLKATRNSKGLARVNKILIDTGFREGLDAEFEWLAVFQNAGSIETEGTAYRYASAYFKERKIDEIGQLILALQRFIDNWSSEFDTDDDPDVQDLLML